jgi:TetR/AcrR family transcriptional regulator, cholesterol catabolism regulator
LEDKKQEAGKGQEFKVVPQEVCKMPPKAGTQKKSVILTEATKLFYQNGYDGTSMEDIAASVSLLKGSLYHYFKSKDEILLQIVKPPLEVAIASLEKVLESDTTPVEKLRSAIYAHLKVKADDKFRISLVLQENFNSVNKEISKEIFQLKMRLYKLWKEIILSGITAGQFRSDLNPELTCFAIIGMCKSYEWYRPGGRLSASQAVDQYFTIVTRGMLTTDSVLPQAEPISSISERRTT